MKKIQLAGLGLILLSGILSQFTQLKQSQFGVWILAGLAIVGMIFVLYNWFKTW